VWDLVRVFWDVKCKRKCTRVSACDWGGREREYAVIVERGWEFHGLSKNRFFKKNN
jgi:hypothetical protein